MGADPTPAPRRGRPRSEQARAATLDAAMELLLDSGLRAMSVDDIADRAGVSKATIYRWWPRKELLALEAVVTRWGGAPGAVPDSGSLAGDLRARLRAMVRELGDPAFGRVLVGLLAEAHADEEFAALFRNRFVEPRRSLTRALFRRALDRGEIPADTDLEVALDLVTGPLFYRLLTGHAPLDEEYADGVIETVVTALRANAESPPA